LFTIILDWCIREEISRQQQESEEELE